MNIGVDGTHTSSRGTPLSLIVCICNEIVLPPAVAPGTQWVLWGTTPFVLTHDV